jgi:toxin ParE1/3/4
MKLVWTETAAEDLAEIVAYIGKDSQETGRMVAKSIVTSLERLPAMPFIGRKRAVDTSRELIFPPWPYLALYEVIDEKVIVKAIRHTKRDWRS